MSRNNGLMGTPVKRGSLDSFEILSAEERETILRRWNNTACAIAPATVPELFEAQVARTPGNIAVVYEEQSLTYAELNRRANQLAHRLIRLGVKPDSLVEIALERSLEMAIGLLGILKAGGAYVPLDPEYPLERLRLILADARLIALLTQSFLLKNLSISVEGHRILLDGDVFHDEPTTVPVAPLHTGHLAYVIFTSGSTGRPKGVQITHSALHNRLAWLQHCYQLTANDVVLQKTPLSFDVSVREFFWPLVSGGRLLIAPPRAHRDPVKLLDLIRQHCVTVLNFVPSMLHAFVAHSCVEYCRSVRLVISGGELLSSKLQAQVAARLSHALLANQYGPTEATINATYWICKADESSSVPIGRPNWNTQIYVLDARMQPVPTGAAGEVYIAGVSLARGYLISPALTAERFVANPFGPPGARMYRTGDLARWRADGVLDFVGRIDDQIKLHGVRIEPGEIEAALLRHAAVTQAAVVAYEDTASNKRLIAYVVATRDAVIDSAEMRAYLSRALPAYMVPSAFVALDKLPLTTNGKLDRHALPAPEWVAKAVLRSPRTPQEEILCALFAEVLCVAYVGTDDNFFELGGHSLLAMRLISRIRATLDVELPVRSLFEAPTVEALAQALSAGGVPRPALRIYARPAQIPLFYAQRRLWFLDRLEGRSATYTMPIALRLTGELDHPALEAALADVVERHESLRTIFPDTLGVPRQQILSACAASPRLEVTFATEAILADALAGAARRRFDLASEPPLRAQLFSLGSSEHVLLLLLHHIAGDGWSIAPLWRDLAAAYAARRIGQAPALPALPMQYADYTLWQHELLGDESDDESTIARQLAFWRITLAGLPEQLDLPSIGHALRCQPIAAIASAWRLRRNCTARC